MPSSNESTNDIVSDRESHFIPQSDDDQVLWEVQEITAERGKRYRVKWVGIDPDTGKPWAQSWVAKHDCTDKLVGEWKAKNKRLAAGKKRGHKSMASRASGSSKRAESSTSGKKAVSSTSEAKTSRLNSVEQPLPLPPKKSPARRKRRFETTATTSSGAVQTDEESELLRPLKRQKIALETLLPLISSSSDEDALLGPEAYAKVNLPKKVPPKLDKTSLDESDEDDSSPPKAKGRLTRPSGARSAGTIVSSRASGLRVELGSPHSKTKTKTTPRREKSGSDADPQLSDVSQDEASKPKKKSMSKRKSPSKKKINLSEKEVDSAVSHIKIGPPRGVKKRLRVSGGPDLLSKHVPPRAKPQEDDSGEERVPGEESKRYSGNESPSPLSIQLDAVDSPALKPSSPHISIPQDPRAARPHSPDLSPGARARLELFDRMMAGTPQPDAPASKGVPDDVRFTYGDAPVTHDGFDVIDPPQPISPPPSKSKRKRSKLGTPNGLIVPETESSGNSQGPSQSLPRLPSPPPPPARDQPPHKPIDLPALAVTAASATSSSTPPRNLFPSPEKNPPYTNRPSKTQTFKPIILISPNTFRSTINARSHVADSEAPPSSIESFTSPKHVDKGKQRAVESDQLQCGLSEVEGDGERRKKQSQRKITDSELKKKGKELFDQVQVARDAERQKEKKEKRLKTVNDIVHKTIPSPSKGSPLPSTSKGDGASGLQWEEVTHLSGGANSTTLDTLEHSEARPLGEKEMEQLRIELRQEEEENTQEAMSSCPLPFVKENEIMNGGDGGDAQLLLLRGPKSPFSGQNGDINNTEQPSTDLQQASVIVQASQEQRQEDTDMELLSSNQPASSPPRPIPENLTDSPKRRLGEALSLLNVKSEEIQRLEHELADERKTLQGLKAELVEIQQSSRPTGPVLAAWEAERAQWTQERSKWENDFSEWQTQRKVMSEEKANLSARVAELSDVVARAEEARVKSEAERDDWIKERDTMLNDMSLRSEELAVLAKVRGECDQDRLKWEIERASWVEEKAKWETERVALQEKQEVLLRSVDELTVKVESMTAAKVSAEKDREFFREQYAQASGFVDSVREENMELEKRAKIAEGQAQEGVVAIKALFEGRTKALQADIDRWKGLTELLQEKDSRTNDELRLQAAQAPELRDLCGRLDKKNTFLQIRVRKLELARQRSVIKQKKLYYETFALKKERASLRSKLAQMVKVADDSTRDPLHSAPAPVILEDPESMDPNDMETPPDPTTQSVDVSFDEAELFPCMWRPQWRDQCQHIFDTKEDLERHMQDHFRDLLTQ